MQRKIIFLGLVLSIFYLSSCGVVLIKPEDSIGDVNYKVTAGTNDEKTVEIINEKKKQILSLAIPKL